MIAENLNSRITHVDEEHAIKNLGMLANVWATTPVYLVNEQLMDRLYPPRKLRDYDRDRLRQVLGRLDNEKREGDDFCACGVWPVVG